MPHDPYAKTHPIAFVLALIALAYGVWAGGVAMTDIHKCRVGSNENRSWRWMPPEWECGNAVSSQP